ncbi:ABC transporter substrate-binding protein [Bradyrhizobium sp. McL0616]|uniref:ABC transporter substrate-binding protein n=1 Tax=Bradyrhizobium sp. McL0616 TaxID=3415674 RepID=UPI003CE9D342
MGFASLALVGGALAWFRSEASSAAQNLEDVQIAAVAYVGSCPILMAHAMGYLANEGISATIRFQENGKAALAQVLDGKAGLATTAEFPVMYAAMSSKPVSVVATMTTMEDHAILGRRDHGVIGPASLKGKRIGVSLGTTTQFFLDAFLNRQRLSAADVTVVDLKPIELNDAIVRGNIDAVVVYQPFLDISTASIGADAIVMSGEAVYDVLFTLAGTREYVRDHGKTIEKVLRATIRGARYCKDFPEEAARTLADPMGADPAKLVKIWPSYQFEVTLRQGLLLTLEDEARWAIRNNLVPESGMPNFLEHLGLAPLQAVSPPAVTVIH